MKTTCIKMSNPVLGEIRKNTIGLSSAELAQREATVNDKYVKTCKLSNQNHYSKFETVLV